MFAGAVRLGTASLPRPSAGWSGACVAVLAAGGPGTRSPAHARGAPAVVRRPQPINTGPACPPGGDREWGLRPHARTTCRATTWVFRQAHLTGCMQGGGGVCGRRPHSRSPLGRHAERVLMPPLHRALRWSTAWWAGERRRRRRPAATAARAQWQAANDSNGPQADAPPTRGPRWWALALPRAGGSTAGGAVLRIPISPQRQPLSTRPDSGPQPTLNPPCPGAPS